MALCPPPLAPTPMVVCLDRKLDVSHGVGWYVTEWGDTFQLSVGMGMVMKIPWGNGMGWDNASCLYIFRDRVKWDGMVGMVKCPTLLSTIYIYVSEGKPLHSISLYEYFISVF